MIFGPIPSPRYLGGYPCECPRGYLRWRMFCVLYESCNTTVFNPKTARDLGRGPGGIWRLKGLISKHILFSENFRKILYNRRKIILIKSWRTLLIHLVHWPNKLKTLLGTTMNYSRPYFKKPELKIKIKQDTSQMKSLWTNRLYYKYTLFVQQ